MLYIFQTIWQRIKKLFKPQSEPTLVKETVKRECISNYLKRLRDARLTKNKISRKSRMYNFLHK